MKAVIIVSLVVSRDLHEEMHAPGLVPLQKA